MCVCLFSCFSDFFHTINILNYLKYFYSILLFLYCKLCKTIIYGLCIHVFLYLCIPLYIFFRLFMDCTAQGVPNGHLSFFTFFKCKRLQQHKKFICYFYFTESLILWPPAATKHSYGSHCSEKQAYSYT